MFGGFFVFLTVGVFLNQNNAYFDVGIPQITYLTIFLTSLIVGIIYMLLGAVYITAFRRWRQLVEMIPLIFFTNSMLGIVFPTFVGFEAEGITSSIIYFATCMFLYSLIYGTLLDRFPMFLSWETKARFSSARDAKNIFKELVPGVAPVEQHWDKLLHEVTPDPDDQDSLELTYTHGHSLYQHQTITFLEFEPNRHAKYYFVGDVDPKNRSLTEGTYTVDITPREAGGCDVYIKEMHTALLPRVGIIMWFDDLVGDSADHIVSIHKGKRDWSISGLYRQTVLPLS
ncbi:hypothetical protein O2N63_09550 [Aliiroseovarius sp. KMU-50]|uniref:Uncharacterized protein n=1 Tax=Aliiroseovarius salicola TaxID=3009082 RepID=A0ABT4W1F1_9RHOB|nr:hypothetical protein [Aliiroseovarius sp. KMU-50]MDA5094333.1 hypothetical protein [Aliiroseovarius sp. KMU-50]